MFGNPPFIGHPPCKRNLHVYSFVDRQIDGHLSRPEKSLQRPEPVVLVGGIATPLKKIRHLAP